MAGKKQDVITLKVERSLAEALEGVSNRSRFIRDAILAALENVCPLCMGTGILTPAQKQHWTRFAQGHSVRQCPDCHERHLTCSHEHGKAAAPRPGARRGAEKARREKPVRSAEGGKPQ